MVYYPRQMADLIKNPFLAKYLATKTTGPNEWFSHGPKPQKNFHYLNFHYLNRFFRQKRVSLCLARLPALPGKKDHNQIVWLFLGTIEATPGLHQEIPEYLTASPKQPSPACSHGRRTPYFSFHSGAVSKITFTSHVITEFNGCPQKIITNF